MRRMMLIMYVYDKICDYPLTVCVCRVSVLKRQISIRISRRDGTSLYESFMKISRGLLSELLYLANGIRHLLYPTLVVQLLALIQATRPTGLYLALATLTLKATLTQNKIPSKLKFLRVNNFLITKYFIIKFKI